MSSERKEYISGNWKYQNGQLLVQSNLDKLDAQKSISKQKQNFIEFGNFLENMPGSQLGLWK